MPWKYTDEYYREYTRSTWNESSSEYERVARNLTPYRVDLVNALAVTPGESVLDIGTGPGEPALTIAGLVGREGHVTGIDLAERMIDRARQAADERGVGNATFRAMDSSRLDFPDGRFDVACSSFGFQIFTDPERAAREAHRVLRPGGRIGVSVWGLGPRVPAIDVLIAPMLEHAEPDETGYLPTPYETGGPGEMVAFLEAAGFRSATERRVSHEWTFATPDEYLDSVLTATPIGHSLREESPEVQAEVLRAARKNLERWTGPEGVRLPAEAAIVTALR